MECRSANTRVLSGGGYSCARRFAKERRGRRPRGRRSSSPGREESQDQRAIC